MTEIGKSMQKDYNKKVFERVREYVRLHSTPGLMIPIDQVSDELDISEEEIFLALSDKALLGDLIGLNLFVTFEGYPDQGY